MLWAIGWTHEAVGGWTRFGRPQHSFECSGKNVFGLVLLWDLKATRKGTRLVEVPWFGCISNEVQLLMQSTATYAWKQFIYRLEKKWKITWKFWGSITSYLLHQEFEVIVENNSLFSTCRSEGLQPLQKTASNGFNKDSCTVFILPYDINLNLSCDYHENYFSIKKWHKKI